jgi:hypothetical protein
MYNLGYNCYLNLKELDIFGNKLNYTPSNYTPYPGLKRLKEFVRGNMAHGKG